MSFLCHLLLLLSLSTPHDFHVSIAQVDYRDSNLQMTLRVFTEDLEDRLQLKLGENELPQTDSIIASYLEDKVGFKLEGQPLPMTFIGKEIEFELCYLYLEFPCPERPKSLQVSNRIFFDSFDDQSNIVNVKVGETLRSAFLSSGNGESNLKF